MMFYDDNDNYVELRVPLQVAYKDIIEDAEFEEIEIKEGEQQ